MNKALIFFSLILAVSICLVTTPNTAHADTQLDILIKITQNTQGHIKQEIQKLKNVTQQIYYFYDSGTSKYLC